MTDVVDLKMPVLLGLRRHLSVIHHLPGRIRLRLGPALWSDAARFGRDQFRKLIDGLAGIHGVRVNAAVASMVIEYDPEQIPPENWEILLRGDDGPAGDLLNHWLAQHGQLLQYTLNR